MTHRYIFSEPEAFAIALSVGCDLNGGGLPEKFAANWIAAHAAGYFDRSETVNDFKRNYCRHVCGEPREWDSADALAAPADEPKVPDQDFAGLVIEFEGAVRKSAGSWRHPEDYQQQIEADLHKARSALLARYESMRVALERIANATVDQR